MRKTITPAEMKRVETRVMQNTPVTGEMLMHLAAGHVADAVRDATDGREGLVVCYCGTGNNGGDGMAAMRLLAQADERFRGLCVVMHGPLSSDAQRELHALAQAAGDRVIILRLAQEEIPQKPEHSICVIDALFGTGLSRALEGTALALCRQINELAAQGTPVVAVDIPSGLNGAAGRVMGQAVHATHTVTFHRPKTGLYLGAGPDHTGFVTVADIGLNAPLTAPYDDADGFAVMQRSDLAALLPPRRRCTHKGSYGRVLLWAGSEGMAGAAASAATAALRTGAGLVTVACPKEVLPVVQMLCPCATCLPLDAQGAWQTLLPALERADALGMGCGLGQGAQADALLQQMLQWLRTHPLPVVMDADALNLLARQGGFAVAGPCVMTPHPAEAARLLGQDTAEVLADVPQAAAELAARFGASVVLKGPCDVLCSDGRMAVNPYGTPAMAKGGSGDALTGVLAALLAGRAAGAYAMDELTLMQTGCALHGIAGERAAEACGERGMLATDLCLWLGREIAAGKEQPPVQPVPAAVGRRVTVTVEHAAGTRADDVHYHRNCGYVQEVLAECNEWQDAVLAGETRPLEWFEGVVAAELHTGGRTVWLVTPDGQTLDATALTAEQALLEQLPAACGE